MDSEYFVKDSSDSSCLLLTHSLSVKIIILYTYDNTDYYTSHSTKNTSASGTLPTLPQSNHVNGNTCSGCMCYQEFIEETSIATNVTKLQTHRDKHRKNVLLDWPIIAYFL